MNKLLNKLCVDGYNPFNILNLILSAVSGGAFALAIYAVSEGELWDDSMNKTLLVGIACFLILLFRNRKLKSIPKMIIFSVVSAVIGVFIAIIGFVLFIIIGLFSGGNTSAFKGAASKIANAASSGGNNNGQDTGFSKQDDLNAQMQGYANAQQYQDLTGYSGHDINPDDDYTRA